MSSIEPFVRREMLPESPAPTGNTGIILWVRENLFNGPFNSILTVVLLVAIYSVLNSILSWALQSSWTANSLSECREVINAAYGEDVHGACWAVIRDRFLQLIYGFYPSELYWRVNLTFVLMKGIMDYNLSIK